MITGITKELVDIELKSQEGAIDIQGAIYAVCLKCEYRKPSLSIKCKKCGIHFNY